MCTIHTDQTSTTKFVIEYLVIHRKSITACYLTLLVSEYAENASGASNDNLQESVDIEHNVDEDSDKRGEDNEETEEGSMKGETRVRAK